MKNGFAIVATLMIMTLLLLMAFAMMSLSSTTTRTTSTNDADAEAKANARMALMLAIGELQMHSGADTRITAPAELLEAGAPPLTGVWRSWEGTNHDATGRPIQPDYSVKTQRESDGGRFLTWLVSGAQPGQEPLSPAPTALVSTSATADTIPLLSTGTLGTNPGQVHVVPQLLEDNSGAIAWWASPENQKSRLSQPHLPKSDDMPGWLSMMQTSNVPDPKVFGLEDLLNEKEDYNYFLASPKSIRKTVSRKTLQLIDAVSTANADLDFHNISSSSIGLLTNVATGGWKKDLSVLSERWDTVYGAANLNRRLPLFRILPTAGSVTSVPKPTVAPFVPAPVQSLFYPWTAYPARAAVLADSVVSRNGASSSWASLIDFANSYKQMSFNSATNKLSTTSTFWPIWQWRFTSSRLAPMTQQQAIYNGMHTTSRAPVISRIQFTFYVRAQRVTPLTAVSPASNNDFALFVMVKPTITMWNPYNTELTIDKATAMSWNKSIPMVFAMHNQTRFPATAPTYKRMFRGSIYDSENNSMYDNAIPQNTAKGYGSAADFFISNGLIFHFPDTYTLAPGEAITVSASEQAVDGQTGVKVASNFGHDGAIQSGWVSNDNGNNRLRGFRWDDTMKIYMKFDNYTKNGADAIDYGPGYLYMYGVRSAGADPQVARYVKDCLQQFSMITNENFATTYWQTPVDLPEYVINEIATNDNATPAQPTSNAPWTPVFSVVMGPRFTVGAGANNPTDKPTKGLLQNNPFLTAINTSNEVKASNHPINMSYDFIIHGHEDGGSNTVPEDSTREGYMGTGFQSGNGLSHLILTELPTKPMNSLLELQHWNLQGGKVLPPYQYYIIGNSNAHPMLPKDDVVADRTATASTNQVHDDSYCANHLLFDDWFFSTIAPEPTNLGSTISSTIQQVYKDLLMGNKFLTNRAYRTARNFAKMTDAQATAQVTATLDSVDGWQKVASQLEVDGMFNVNSTSVKAWRALLGHARQMEIYYHTKSGIVQNTGTVDYVLSRHTIPGDIEADPGEPGAGGVFNGASEYGGFRKLSEADLDQLAEAIVDQIKLRGPFLSFSEFINRSLSTDDEIAIAGAVQSALNTLGTAAGTTDPNAFLKDLSYASTTIDPADPSLAGVDVYEYDEAAAGYSTFGLPGWITQADVLRPIAPILTARDDTFTIRAYGDARDLDGNVTARAWCEATVQRTREYLEISDAADRTDAPLSAVNQTYGRRYEIVAFRWLPEEDL